jgi:hypothetical protein
VNRSNLAQLYRETPGAHEPSELSMSQPVLTLAAEWATFEGALMPSVPDAQARKVFRRAFYAGALAMLHIQANAGGDMDVTEADMAARMEAICDELRGFAGKMALDRA